eukprot:986444-Ditylum_brightwellii.AAC.1
MSLANRLNTSTDSKALWLQSMSIAVHDFRVVHERTPCQPTITTYFQPTDDVVTTATLIVKTSKEINMSGDPSPSLGQSKLGQEFGFKGLWAYNARIIVCQ